MSVTEPPLDPSVQSQIMLGGNFPGTASTEATPVGSDQPVQVKIGQADNRHLQLSKEEFRARSARQKALEAQGNTGAPPTPEPPVEAGPPVVNKGPAETSRARPKKKPYCPKGAAQKPKPAVPADKLIGGPYPGPSTTKAQSPTPAPPAPVPIPTEAMLEQRMSRLERGMDAIIRAIAERDAREATPAPMPAADSVPPVTTGYDPRTGPHACCANEDDYSDEDEYDNMPEPGESFDEPPAQVVSENPEEPTPIEAGLQRLQQIIIKRNPQKFFRQYWYQLTRAAQYNEWSAERRETFDQVFNSVVAHPKFIHQMSTFLRGSRSGQCIGDEQIARVCGMVAGFLTVYQLATAGK